MCGCGKSSAEETYKVYTPDGGIHNAKSEVEARVMIAKAGGGTMRKV